MIIDARCRPPVKYFLDQVMYRSAERTIANSGTRGYTASSTITTHSISEFWSEVEQAGVTNIVVPGRLPNTLFGGSSDITSLYDDLGHDSRVTILEAIAATDTKPTERILKAQARGAKGLVFEPGLDPGCYLDDARNNLFYECATQSGLPVYIMGGGNAGPDVSFASPVALDRVASRYPDLTLVAVHAGWPWVQEMLGVAFRRSNVWVLPDLYFPGMPGEGDFIKAMSGYLQDRFLFASAYPFCNLPELVERYRQLPLSDSVFEKIFYQNAQRLFGIGNSEDGPSE